MSSDNYRRIHCPKTAAPVWVVADGHAPRANDPELSSLETSRSPVAGRRNCVLYRGVSIDRLDAVLEHGVDVEPTDSPFFCDDHIKAWEYSATGFMYALDGSRLEPSDRVLPADATPSEVAAVRALYPNQIDSSEGRLTFTRFPERGGRGGSNYHGFWVPEDSRAVLLAVFVRERYAALLSDG